MEFYEKMWLWVFLNENVWISINISLKFVPRGPMNNIPTLVQVMAWRRPGDKPLSEPMMARLPTHICVTRPQWVKMSFGGIFYIAQSLGYFTLSRLWYRLFIAWFTENLPNSETTCSWQKIYMYWQCSGWSFIMCGVVVDTTACIVLFVLNISSVYLCGN